MAHPVCAVCGNEIDPERTHCPFCRTAYPPNNRRVSGPLHREVHLKKGMPLVQQALDRLEVALQDGIDRHLKALTLIHGYGSSGTGGAIKAAVHRQLREYLHQGRIEAIIPGEEFEGRSGRGRHLLRRFPFLADHRDLNRANPGITLLIL